MRRMDTVVKSVHVGKSYLFFVFYRIEERIGGGRGLVVWSIEIYLA